MNIAFILGEFPSYSETFIFDQIKWLIAKGHRVDIFAITSGISKSEFDYFNKEGILERVNYVWPDPEKNFLLKIYISLKFFFKLLKSDIRELKIIFSFSQYYKRIGQLYSLLTLLALDKKKFNNYEIFHAHFGQYGILAVFLRDIYSFKAKVITTFHGHDLNVIPAKYGNGIYKKLFQRGDCFTVNSSFSYEKLIKLGCPPEKILKIPIGVELSKFPFRIKTLASGEKIQILTVARLVEVKGLQYAIKALALLKKKNLSFKYLIVGEGPLKKQLKYLVKTSRLEDSIEFLGAKPHEDVQRLYAQAHIFILPSIIGSDNSEETQGLSLIEAQASGLPVLSTLVGGIPESIMDGSSGFLVPPKNVDALTNKLDFLTSHPEMWPEMGRKGRVHVEKNFNCDSLSDLLMNAYNSLINT